MKLKKRWIALYVVLALLLAAAYGISRPGPLPYRGGGGFMQGIDYHEYGKSDVLRFEKLEKSVPLDDQVLIKVRAASVNPLDWHFIRGVPYVLRITGAGLRRPADPRLGADVAGIVESVGKSVTQFKVGDEVFGTAADGAFAEYAVADEKKLVLKPADVSFEQAATIGVAATTALQALRDKGHLQSGQTVLVNGASGGVGTFAVQIAKSMGATVTGVCSTRNVELVQSLGAAEVVDYTHEDFTQGTRKYDLIIDNVGNHSLSELRRVLNPTGTYVLVGGGGPDDGQWLGPMITPMKEFFYSPFVSQSFVMILSEITHEDLIVLQQMLQSKQLTPVIDRTYKLSDVAAAISYLEAGHARGKVVISLP